MSSPIRVLYDVVMSAVESGASVPVIVLIDGGLVGGRSCDQTFSRLVNTVRDYVHCRLSGLAMGNRGRMTRPRVLRRRFHLRGTLVLFVTGLQLAC